jgi:iron only hydrogenase large subunit-like protein
MNYRYPVYTIENECQDCYKCIRRCPVKAIKIEDGHAAVIPELCIACGRCVETCPAEAKQVRNDLETVRKLLKSGENIYVSLAPSWISEFKNVSKAQMCAAFRLLGFAGASETALGAQLVSAHVAKTLNKMKRGVLISSACPAAVDMIRKYIPEFAECLTKVGSPAMSHCRYLQEKFGEAIKVVFIGPCIAKKNEADRRPDLMAAALGFHEFKHLLAEQRIAPETLKPEQADRFVPDEAAEGALYPIEGGMIETIKMQCKNPHVQYAAVTGIENLELALNGLHPQDIGELIFLEVLACAGGCVHGPCTEHDSPGLLERLRVLNYIARMPAAAAVMPEPDDIAADFPADAAAPAAASEAEIAAALRQIGKLTPADELNCGGCGYDNCRTFAAAMIRGRAEASMCASFMRKQAQKKANALLRCIPSGVVIVDRALKLVECNRAFAELFGEDTLAAFEALPGMAGADLTRIVPFAGLFENALRSGADLRRDSYKFERRLLNITIFTIEPHEVVGAVIFDVTSTEMRREEIARRARQVINKNLETVQEIACRLGENMADTEIILRSIADDYADENMFDPDTPETGIGS